MEGGGALHYLLCEELAGVWGGGVGRFMRQKIKFRKLDLEIELAREEKWKDCRWFAASEPSEPEEEQGEYNFHDRYFIRGTHDHEDAFEREIEFLHRIERARLRGVFDRI